VTRPIEEALVEVKTVMAVLLMRKADVRFNLSGVCRR
jgi:hypothetical protein